MFYEEVFQELDRKKVKYLAIGGIAVNLYGYVRLTVDLDIMLDLSEENLSRFIKAIEKLGFVPRVPVAPKEFVLKKKREEWVKEKDAVVFTFIDPKSPFKHIDVFLNNPIDFEKAYSNREVIEAEKVKISLVSLDDLIRIKLLAGRPRDLEDVHHLKRITEREKE